MNKFINKILKEAEEMNDDPFFQPKDMKKRKEEEERKWKKIFAKIENGVQSIKVDYKNKNWDSEQEKLFLKIFSKLRLNEKYDKKWNGYFLKDENDNNICFFSLKGDTVWISYNNVWRIFGRRFHWKYDEIERFMRNMLKKHFKLYEFAPGTDLGGGYGS